MPAPCSVPPFLEGKLYIQHFETLWRKTSFQVHKLYTKKYLFGMKKMHSIVGAAVKHKAPLTALARLTLACISPAGYLTHLTTHPPLLFTLQHGWLGSHQDLHRDGLCWSNKCFSLSCTQLNLGSFLVSLVLPCLSVSGSFLIKLAYLTQ